jgi:5-(hydroxymethyl)furfural/furfural oxidase
MDCDTVIVGGGTAGTVLANRLSARSGHRVMLCEAGRDIREGDVPEQILDSFAAHAFLDSRFLWNELRVTTGPMPHNQPDAPPPLRRRYEQARVLGGGSAINGQLANRGGPMDYDEWEERGAAGWNWAGVLPYFRKLERDIDFEGPLHGSDGPMPIRRIFPPQWAGQAKAVAAGFEALGFRYIADQNGPFEDGYHPLAITNLYDRRVPAAIAYLTPAVRARPNLAISTDTHVTSLTFDGDACTGVSALREGREITVRAKEVILCSGAIYTPAHLLRAGIGPAGHLRDRGIPVRRALAGVGQRLMDHPSVALAAFIRPHARLGGRTRRHLLVGLRFSSDLPGMPVSDMAVSVSTKAAWHAVGEQICSVTTWVNKTFSDAGEVRLASADWRDEPEVHFRLLSDRRDLDRLMAAMRRLRPVFDTPAMREAVCDPFAASFSDKVRQVGVINRKNAVLTAIMARLLDGPEPFRRLLMRRFIIDAPPLDELLADDEALEDFIRNAAVGVWHASCACRMGSRDDPMAVTDSSGRVHGMGGLRIVDASIFPCIPRANINLPTIMVAERIADLILAEH